MDHDGSAGARRARWGFGWLLLAVAGLLLAGRPDPARANPGNPPSPGAADAYRLVATDQAGGVATALAATDSLLLLGVGPRLQVWDLGEPVPLRLGQSPLLPGTVTAIRPFLPYVAVATSQGVALILNLSDPGRPVIQATLASGFVADIALSGETLLLADRDHGLALVDLARPAQPQTRLTLDPGGPAMAVGASATTAYVAAGFAGLVWLDLTPGLPPAVLGSLPLTAWQVWVGEGLALVATDFAGGLTVVDLSRPGGPITVATYQAGGTINDVAFNGNQSYLALASGAVESLDLSFPAQPTALGLLDLPSAGQGVASTATRLFAAAADHGILTWNLADLPSGAVPAQLTTAGAGPAYDARAYRDELIFTAGSAGLMRWNRVTGIVRTTDLPGEARGLALVDDRAYVALGPAGLGVVDLASAGGVTLEHELALGGFAHQVVVVDSWAYVAAGSAGLVVVNLAGPEGPQVVAHLALAGQARDLVVAQGRAYVADWSGLAVIDLNDPVAPALLGRMETPGYAAGLALQGDRVYVADWSGLSLISITDPARPFLVNHLPLPGQAQGVAVAGSWAYVAVGDQGLQVIDLVAFAPAEQFDSAGTGRRVSLASTELLLADHSGGVLVLSREAAMRAVYLPLVQVSRP